MPSLLHFSKIDLRSDYWYVETGEKDKARIPTDDLIVNDLSQRLFFKTVYQVGTIGFFEMNRMLFGLCNSPATFCCLMEWCVRGMNLRIFSGSRSVSCL